jgi:pseudouridine kinase
MGRSKILRLTAREQEIFEILAKEPLISQEDLARRFGLSRSSVAVHISNLMKKGAILGKGYVLSKQTSVAVVGDIYLHIEVDETQGKIDVIHSGSAYELSTMFAHLGIQPKVITVLGNDDLGNQILTQMQQLSIDTGNIVRLTNRRTCRRIYANEQLIYEEALQPSEMQQAISLAWAAFNCEYLVVDPHHQSIINHLICNKDEEQVPFLCTYGYPADESDISEIVSHFSIAAFGVHHPSALDRCINRCLDAVKNDRHLLVITDGSHRLVYINNAEIFDFPLLPGQAFACGTGIPRLLAGVIYGLSNRYPARQAVRIGVGAASSKE